MLFETTTQYVRDDLKLHLYSQAFLNNLAALKSLCSDSTKFCAVVKSDGYGCGLRNIVKILKPGGVDFFAVANICEAAYIEDIVGDSEILILEPVHTGLSKERIRMCAEKGWHCAIVDGDSLEWVLDCLKGSSLKLKLHVKVETGMGRCGTSPENAARLIGAVDTAESLTLAGIYTHFSTAAESSLSFADTQLGRFKKFLANNSLIRRDDVIIHAANSVTTLNIPDAHFDMVRCGIAMHGWGGLNNSKAIFIPATKLEGHVVQLNKFKKGQTIGYGRTYTTQRDTLAAVVPIGYADNYWRLYSNRAVMKLGNSYAPVIGRVSMDKTLIDVTDIADVRVGQDVTIIDNEPSSRCGVYTLAELADTICHEVLTSVPARAKRIIH